MLELDVTITEAYDEKLRRFVVERSVRVRLEHSLVSMSKWESLWKVPFLGNKEKTPGQVLSYLRLMIVDDDIAPDVWRNLVEKHQDEIKAYIDDSMTATTIYVDPKAPKSREKITAELIYYWMISHNIPHEFEHWHLNRLVTLIRVFNAKNTKKKPMTLAERKALNEARLKQHKTRG